MKVRLDQLAVDRGLAGSRDAAQRLILEGRVFVNGQRADKPGLSFDAKAEVELRGDLHPYVSRGGVKLAGALDAFGIAIPPGCLALDIGASTGGFTDCLLQRGAGRVVAVDTGKGQISERLRVDPRVRLLEKTNARYLDLAAIGGEKVDCIVIDVSFISLRLILPQCRDLLKADGNVIALVKPQFEAARGEVERGGVVRDRAIHRSVLEGIVAFAGEEGWRICGMAASPLRGAEGNIEFFLWLSAGGSAGAPAIDISRTLEDAYSFLSETKPTEAGSEALKAAATPSERTGGAQARAKTAPVSLVLDGFSRKPGLERTLESLVRWAAAREHHVLMSAGLRALLEGQELPSGRVHVFADEDAIAQAARKSSPPPGVVLSMGGDGSLLRAVQKFGFLGVPFLGVNLGAVGFNALVSPERLGETLDAWEAGRTVQVDHMALHARLVRRGSVVRETFALNEVLLQRTSEARMLQLEVRQGDALVLAYYADGLVVSTPTGSTAYSLSAGGPILHPSLRSFLVTGLEAYTMTSRPIVLPPAPGLTLRFRAHRAAGEAVAHIDGQERWDMEDGDSIEIVESPDGPVSIVNPPGVDYFDTLRSKLHWSIPIKPIEP